MDGKSGFINYVKEDIESDELEMGLIHLDPFNLFIISADFNLDFKLATMKKSIDKNP